MWGEKDQNLPHILVLVKKYDKILKNEKKRRNSIYEIQTMH